MVSHDIAASRSWELLSIIELAKILAAARKKAITENIAFWRILLKPISCQRILRNWLLKTLA
jgi:hypothetical protein